jgi:hypothetical protein
MEILGLLAQIEVFFNIKMLRNLGFGKWFFMIDWFQDDTISHHT